MSTDSKFGMLLGLAVVVLSAVFAATPWKSSLGNARPDGNTPQVSLPPTMSLD